MILNSRKRRQIRQTQYQGQAIIAAIHGQMTGQGMDAKAADSQLSQFIAPGSTKLGWWADVRFVQDIKAHLKRKAKEAGIKPVGALSEQVTAELGAA